MPELNGARPVEQEAVLLAESYAYAAQREVSQVTLQQHQARIAELVHRQSFRLETGHQLLTPLRTRVDIPMPPPMEPEPVAGASPMAMVIDGLVVARTAAHAAPDPGRVQRQQEQAYRGMNLEEAAKVSTLDAAGKVVYYTPADRQRQQEIENTYAAREAWRDLVGQDYIPSAVEWLRGQMEPSPEAPPAADEGEPAR